MVEKIGGLARLAATALAIIAGFVALPGVNMPLVLVVLGLIAGVLYTDERIVRLFLVVLVLPLAGTALHQIPAIGEQLNAAALNLALAAAAMAATAIALRLFDNSKRDLTAWTGKATPMAPAAASHAA